MSIKKILLQEIESSPEFLLEETLDFLRFLKTKQKSARKDTDVSDTQQVREPKQTDSHQPAYRPASGRSILRHAGTWSGDDFHECLQSVYATRGKAKFD
jgi:hypothetical protein